MSVALPLVPPTSHISITLQCADMMPPNLSHTTLGMPAWTVGKSRAELEALALLAGFTGCAILGKFHSLI